MTMLGPEKAGGQMLLLRDTLHGLAAKLAGAETFGTGRAAPRPLITDIVKKLKEGRALVPETDRFKGYAAGLDAKTQSIEDTVRFEGERGLGGTVIFSDDVFTRLVSGDINTALNLLHHAGRATFATTGKVYGCRVLGNVESLERVTGGPGYYCQGVQSNRGFAGLVADLVEPGNRVEHAVGIARGHRSVITVTEESAKGWHVTANYHENDSNVGGWNTVRGPKVMERMAEILGAEEGDCDASHPEYICEVDLTPEELPRLRRLALFLGGTSFIDACPPDLQDKVLDEAMAYAERLDAESGENVFMEENEQRQRNKDWCLARIDPDTGVSAKSSYKHRGDDDDDDETGEDYAEAHAETRRRYAQEEAEGYLDSVRELMLKLKKQDSCQERFHLMVAVNEAVTGWNSRAETYKEYSGGFMPTPEDLDAARFELAKELVDWLAECDPEALVIDNPNAPARLVELEDLCKEASEGFSFLSSTDPENVEEMARLKTGLEACSVTERLRARWTEGTIQLQMQGRGTPEYAQQKRGIEAISQAVIRRPLSSHGLVQFGERLLREDKERKENEAKEAKRANQPKFRVFIRHLAITPESLRRFNLLTGMDRTDAVDFLLALRNAKEGPWLALPFTEEEIAESGIRGVGDIETQPWESPVSPFGPVLSSSPVNPIGSGTIAAAGDLAQAIRNMSVAEAKMATSAGQVEKLAVEHLPSYRGRTKTAILERLKTMGVF